MTTGVEAIGCEFETELVSMLLSDEFDTVEAVESRRLIDG